MLGSLHVAQDPGKVCPTDGAEACVPRNGRCAGLCSRNGRQPQDNPNDLYSKHIVYIDAEADVVL
jgi:hypothetical protein